MQFGGFVQDRRLRTDVLFIVHNRRSARTGFRPRKKAVAGYTAQAGLACAVLVRSSMVMAEVIIVAMSPRLAGTMRVLLVLPK